MSTNRRPFKKNNPHSRSRSFNNNGNQNQNPNSSNNSSNNNANPTTNQNKVDNPKIKSPTLPRGGWAAVARGNSVGPRKQYQPSSPKKSSSTSPIRTDRSLSNEKVVSNKTNAPFNSEEVVSYLQSGYRQYLSNAKDRSNNDSISIYKPQESGWGKIGKKKNSDTGSSIEVLNEIARGM